MGKNPLRTMRKARGRGRRQPRNPRRRRVQNPRCRIHHRRQTFRALLLETGPCTDRGWQLAGRFAGAGAPGRGGDTHPRDPPTHLRARPAGARRIGCVIGLLWQPAEWAVAAVDYALDYSRAVTALSSSRDSRISWDRSRSSASSIQRSNETLKTAIPACAARLAAGSGTPRWRSASVVVDANVASLISSRSWRPALAAITA